MCGQLCGKPAPTRRKPAPNRPSALIASFFSKKLCIQINDLRFFDVLVTGTFGASARVHAAVEFPGRAIAGFPGA
jgi:hypothetical protein